MGGGLMQLVAYGAQDIYLTGNPQITFFKVVYRRHTNFSMEAIEQTMSGSSSPAVNASGTVTISRNGDLVTKIYVNCPGQGTGERGDTMIQDVELEIGGQRIDKHTAEWMQVWNELSTPESKALGLKAMSGCVGTLGANGTGVTNVQVPLLFWFCRNPGLALPLIALQYHEVKLKINWGAAWTGTAKVLVDYVYLDTDERRRFAQQSHEYLIEQVQTHGAANGANHSLNFNHPVKELIWTSNTGTLAATVEATLKLNGHERFKKQAPEYFQLRQPFDHHTAVPKMNLPSAAQISILDRQVNVTAPTNFTGRLTTDASMESANEFDFVVATNRLALCGAGAATRAEFAVGTQLLLVVTDAGGGNLGHRMYSAQVTVAGAAIVQADTNGTAGAGVLVGGGNAANTVAMTITTPVALTGTVPFFNGAAPADGNDFLSVFIVTNANAAQARTSTYTRNVNVYSFALKPEEHQPSGTCNFSRIDNAQLEFTGTGNGAVQLNDIFAVNYNVLRIMSGMGGLAYSN